MRNANTFRLLLCRGPEPLVSDEASTSASYREYSGGNGYFHGYFARAALHSQCDVSVYSTPDFPSCDTKYLLRLFRLRPSHMCQALRGAAIWSNDMRDARWGRRRPVITGSGRLQSRTAHTASARQIRRYGRTLCAFLSSPVLAPSPPSLSQPLCHTLTRSLERIHLLVCHHAKGGLLRGTAVQSDPFGVRFF